MRQAFTRSFTLTSAGLVAGLVVTFMGLAWAEARIGKGAPLQDIEPAAGMGEGPTLLDARVEQWRNGEDAKPQEAARTDAARGVNILNAADIKATQNALRQARAGQTPERRGVPNELAGYVEAARLLSAKHKATAPELNAWLADYAGHAVAGDIYTLAEARRAKPRQVCTTTSVKPKATKKNKKPKAKKVKSCRTVGEWGPMPPKTAAMLAREARRDAAQEKSDARRAALSTQGRALASEVWRLRSNGNNGAALDALLRAGSRFSLGGAYWQEELVKLADAYHGQRAWPQVYKAASNAAEAQGPKRDEALWLAGYAAYRTGNQTAAAKYWETLVKEEPKNGNHYGRAAFWAARVLADMNETRRARDLLEAGAQAPTTFYGQLAAMKLGRESKLGFAAPGVPSDGLRALLNNEGARRGLMLAQLHETAWAEAELRAATPSLPPEASQALAGVAVALDLPSTALRAGRDLYEEGELVPGALYPLPSWRPEGGWRFDRAFMTGIMRQESAFQPTIGSAVGAQGLMQIMPATGRYIAGMTGRNYRGQSDLHDPETNLAMAQDYLGYLSGKLNGNLLYVAAAYNGGIGNVQRWIARGVTPDTDPLLWLESIPFDETRDYVEKVMVNYWLYQQRLGQPRRTLEQLASSRWP